MMHCMCVHVCVVVSWPGSCMWFLGILVVDVESKVTTEGYVRMQSNNTHAHTHQDTQAFWCSHT